MPVTATERDSEKGLGGAEMHCRFPEPGRVHSATQVVHVQHQGVAHGNAAVLRHGVLPGEPEKLGLTAKVFSRNLPASENRTPEKHGNQYLTRITIYVIAWAARR